MKEIAKKISATLMAFIVVFSTMSFTVSEHYCGDELVASAIFSEVESCGMEMPVEPVEEGCSIKKDNCCTDKHTLIEGQSDLKTSVVKLKLDQQVFTAVFIQSYLNLFEGLEENFIPFKDYSPPLIVRDIQVLDAVFLI